MIAQQPSEAPPVYSVHDVERPKRRWWWRKRVWIPVLVIVLLAIIGITVGAVYGARNSKSTHDQSDRDRLYAAQGETSVNSQADHAATATPSAGSHDQDVYVFTLTVTKSRASTASGSFPTSEPSPPSLPLLRGAGVVPNDLSAVEGVPSSLFWDLRAEGKLFKKEGEGSWEAYHDRQFLVAPVAVSTGEGTQTAISVEAVHGRMVHSHYHDGQWEEWQELEFAAQFRRRPAVVSRAQGRVDVFNVDNDAHLWVVSYDGSSWSEWTELGDGTNGDVAATTWGEDRIDVFAKHGDTTNAPLRHKYWTAESGWAGEWEDLGMPFTSGWDSSPHQTGPEYISSPLAISWCDSAGECKIDVVLNAGSTSHILFQGGAWSDWATGSLGASHEGAEFPDTQSIVKGDGVDGRPFAHLVSRGTDTCIHHIAHNGTDWVSWTYLWCEDREGGGDYPNEHLPTFMTSSDGANIGVFARDLGGNLHRYGFHGTPDEWSSYAEGNDKWENFGQPS